MLRRFYRNCSLFFVPIIVISLFLGRYWLVGYYTGELLDFDNILKRQRADNSVVIGMAYNEQTPYLKVQNANYYQPDIISLGTSRVMQFKDDFFSCSFYNCGGGVSGNYDEYLNFLLNLNYTPKLIIIGLDVWVFNEQWNQGCKQYDEYTEIRMIEREKRAIVNGIEKAHADKKYTVSDLTNFKNNFGINGKIKGNGFLSDGSYIYTNNYRYPELQDDFEFKDTFSRIDNGDYRFEYGAKTDSKTIEELDSFLKYCHNKNIFVVGFLAPMAPNVCSKMIESGDYQYINNISPECERLFSRYAFEYYDYWNPILLDVDDTFFIDGFHGSEVLYALMMIDMINSNSQLSEYGDVENMNRLINERYSNVCFVDPF